MFRSILGIVLGVGAGVLATYVAYALGHDLFPPPAGVDFADPAIGPDAISILPLGAKLAVMAAWAVGVFAGAAVADLVAERRGSAGWLAALVLSGGAASIVLQTAYPAWMVAGAIGLNFGAAYLAWRLFGRGG